MQYDDILAMIRDVRPYRTWHIGKCPAHEDLRQSFSIKLNGDKILVRCFAGCSTSQIVDALGIGIKDLFVNSGRYQGRGRRRMSDRGSQYDTQYVYRDENGAALYRVIRYKEPKSFAQQQYAPTEQKPWINSMEGVTMVPFMLPELIKAVTDGEVIHFVEGEKDVLTLVELGLRATCIAGGSNAWKPSYLKWFAGAKVAVLPDNDAPGYKFAHEVITGLLTVTDTVKLVPVPGPVHSDITDYVQRGHGYDEINDLRISAAMPCRRTLIGELSKHERWAYGVAGVCAQMPFIDQGDFMKWIEGSL